MGTRPLSKTRLVDKIAASRTRKDISEEVKEPLTPLHRLHRFKKIRDRNLKRELLNKQLLGKRPRSVKRSMDTDKASSVGEAKPIAESGPTKVHNKANAVVVQKAAENQQHNGQNGENGTVSEEEEAVRKTRSATPKPTPPPQPAETVPQSEPPREEEVHGMRTRSRPKPSKPEATDNSEETEEATVERSRRSSSKSTPPKSPRDTRKYTPPPPEEDDSDDLQLQIDIDDETEEDKQDQPEDEKEEAEEPKEEREQTPEIVLRRSVRIEALASTISPPSAPASAPGSSTSSPITYNLNKETLSAYRRSPRESYLGRVSGRRPVRGHLTPFRSKRKAEEEVEQEEDKSQSDKSKRRAVSNSDWTVSPGWRYVNKFWSPWQAPDDESLPQLSSTPYKSATSESSMVFSDSMVVNYDDKTEREFPDVDNTEIIAQSTQPSSRWYCNIM